MKARSPTDSYTCLYVAGLAHSGSTYMSRVLNQHSEIFSSGELLDIHEQPDRSTLDCACRYHDYYGHDRCTFWPEVFEDLDWSKSEFDQASRLSTDRRLEWIKSLLNFESLSGNKFVELNDELFSTISNRSKSNIVLDCSKSVWRLLPLWRGLNDQIQVLHLIKSPENQIRSRVNRDYNFYHSAIMKYFRKNYLYQKFFGGSENYLRIKFEKFVKNPEHYLSEIFDWLNIDKIDPFDRATQPFHHIAGGGYRRKNELTRPDQSRIQNIENFTGMKSLIANKLRFLYE